jgi:hypothetical protein
LRTPSHTTRHYSLQHFRFPRDVSAMPMINAGRASEQ